MSNFKVNITGIDTNKLKVLKSDETIELLKRLRAGENVKDEIVMGNLKLVLSAVKPYRSQKYSLDDLFQIGVIGLIKSIDNFDVSKNVMFSTYAVPMIVGEIRRYLRDNNSIRVSRSIRDLAYKVLAAKEKLSKQNGKEPTVEEIAKELEIPKEEIIISMDAIQEPISLQEPVYGENMDNIYVMDQISDKKNTDENWTNSITIAEAIKKLKETGKFNKLNDNLKEIANLRLENPDMPLIELGKKLRQPVGKSGVNYRLKKIMELANE